jgi:sialic acid synthase SpsE
MCAYFSNDISINDRQVGGKHPCYIIAEAGVAQFGDLNKAMKLVELAAEAKADAVKFQMFHPESFISNVSLDWVEKYKSKELPYDAFRDIKLYCAEKGIEFLSTAHDEKSLKFLDSLDVPAYKIGSGEVKNWPFIKKIAERQLPVFLSTGMYSMEDIDTVLDIFKAVDNKDLVILHCITSYPTPYSEVNLRAMDSIKNTFDVMVGYSDHTAGYHIPVAAATRGACVLEKHISIDFNVENAQDWKVSCDANDLKDMVNQIREIEQSLGTGKRVLTKNELDSIKWARKSIVAKRDIPKSTVITNDDVAIKRPGWGIPPSDLENVVGKQCRISIRRDSIIEWEHLS